MKNKKIDFDDLKAILTSIDTILINITNYCAIQEQLNILHNDKVPFDEEPDSRSINLFNIEAYWTLFLSKINKLKECLYASETPSNFDDIISNNPFILWNYFFINARHFDIYGIKDLKNKKKEINKRIYEDYQKSIVENFKKIAVSSPWVDWRKELQDKSFKKYFNEIENNEASILKEKIHGKKGVFSLNIEQAKELNNLIKNNKIEFASPILVSNIDLVTINKISKDKAMELHHFVTALLWEIWAETNEYCRSELFVTIDFINNLWSFWKEGKIQENLKDD